jgi:hypothetical protein
VPFFGPSPKTPPLILVSVYNPVKSWLSAVAIVADSKSKVAKYSRNGSFMIGENYRIPMFKSNNASRARETARNLCEGQRSRLPFDGPIPLGWFRVTGHQVPEVGWEVLLPKVFQIEQALRPDLLHSMSMRMKDVGPKLFLSVRCPTCKVASGKRCLLLSGGLRTESHIDRKLAAMDVVEVTRIRRSKS